MSKDEKQITLRLPKELEQRLEQVRSESSINRSNSDMYLYLIRVGLDSWDKNRHI
ncbi:hypothetical protein [Clostridium sp. D33t1_170424_F3]|uniref:hypothetical protein n=1 Tax=Clostridium sp. D33t1_170424_F3 TaxID=2787099 RepID=UPI0018A9FA67|nr:hypothetical protein [Clostridium sp. D33t1_170424_F3]